ncbi:hypothetical protein [uncultured Maricaulis sp.]|uniref:hypothetical protein n=1 Tax=uncultured Maricaulis sp. TaxID=174710 RepID=UPI0030D9D81F
MTDLYTAPTPNGWTAPVVPVVPVVPDLPCTAHSVDLMTGERKADSFPRPNTARTADAFGEPAHTIVNTGKTEG